MKTKRTLLAASLGVVGLLTFSGSALAQQQPDASRVNAGDSVNAGDTAWVLVSTALVLLMTPGLAFFYGGLVRRKNMLSVLMQCFAALCLVSLQWVLFGYSVAFGPDREGLIGSLQWMGLRGVGTQPSGDYASTVPHLAFMAYQGMFAAITAGLITGAIAERMKFSSFCLFALLWTTVVYDPIAHWVWGMGGFLRQMGTLDFAGGTVVHINAGIAALVGAVVLGKRQRYPRGISPPHNLPYAVLGAALLWFGWFGFNGGSALAANGVAANAVVATHVATASAALVWATLDWVVNRKPTTLGIITGAVAGLVAATPACGYVRPINGIWIGGIAAAICYVFVTVVKPRLGYDDSLDAFGVHGIGGMWGAIATGIWADATVNPAGADGLLRGNAGLMLAQVGAVAVTAAYSFAATWLLMKVVNATIGLRVAEDDERIGLDLTQHRESAYTVLD